MGPFDSLAALPPTESIDISELIAMETAPTASAL